ncbi:MAG: hypothetical protein FIA97_19425 [Methylococcaceae bacterium]|nr:hypothetical protein [Methylococcaceae bacterium]
MIRSVSFPAVASPPASLQNGKGDAQAATQDVKSGPNQQKADLDQQQREIATLQARDREVRTHEAAHLAAAGGYASSGASFAYTRGPAGALYATGGEVQIDTAPVSGDPEATIRKAETVRRAALAPASPSDQDRRVAAAASRMALDAQMQLSLQSRKGSDAAARYADHQSDAPRHGLIDQRA